MFAGRSLVDAFKIDKKFLKMDGPELKQGGFSCQSIVDVLAKKSDPENLLFGNVIQNFIPFQDVKTKQFQDNLQFEEKEDGPPAVKHRSLGLLELQNDKIINYPPIASCSFWPSQDSPLESVKIYYLIDIRKRVLFPYFAIAFYKEMTRIPLSQLTEEVIAELGTEFKVFRGKGPIHYLAQEAPADFDREGDPINLCQFPRKHPYLGAIATDDQENVRYLLLSNINSQCRFGDRMASRFLKGGFK